MRLLSLFVVLGTAAFASCAKDPPSDGGNGGAPASGGHTSSGGTSSGGTSSGGTKGSGGVTGSGGKSASGGVTSTGGTTSSGGTSTSTTPATVDCNDNSSISATVSGQYGGQQISVDNVSGKSYFMQANWWGNPPTAPQEQLSGVGFTINGSVSAGSNVIGFPSIFIGSYQGKNSQGSGLPKQISALTSVPTIFTTNVDSQGSSSYNAAYDVWLTATNAPVTGSSPGTDGAYLMVWQFKPSDKQPRGVIIADGRTIDGVDGDWTVWADTTNPPCVSYVRTTKIADLQFDLNLFIQDAVKQKYGNIKSSQYLSIVFAGFEVWSGGNGLQLKRFCASVK